MKRLVRGAALLLAAAAILLPTPAANAKILSPCDNSDAAGTPILFLPANFGVLGTFEVKLQIGQDNYVKWTGGPVGDWLVGADLQTISLAENTAVCVVTPAGGVMVAVNVVGLGVSICTISPGPGTPPYILDCLP